MEANKIKGQPVVDLRATEVLHFYPDNRKYLTVLTSKHVPMSVKVKAPYPQLTVNMCC